MMVAVSCESNVSSSANATHAAVCLAAICSPCSLHLSLITAPQPYPQNCSHIVARSNPRPPIHVLQSDDSVIPHGLDHSQALWLCAHRSETISKLLFLLFELFLISIPIFEGILCILLIFLYYIRCRFSTYRS